MYANCKFVKGKSRSVICDLQMKKIYFVPNALVNFFSNNQCLIVSEIYFQLDKSNKKIFKEYINFLNCNNLIFEISEDEIQLYPNLKLNFIYPSKITNAIIDLNSKEFNWEEIVIQLEELNCLNLQIRFQSYILIEDLEFILENFSNSILLFIEIILPYQEELLTGKDKLKELLKKNPKIRCLIFYNANKNEFSSEGNDGFGLIHITTSDYTKINCGIVSKNLFTTNFLHYTESLQHNSCLNRKISIDANGDIKNCPSMKESFGNIKDTTLEEALNKSGFKKLWNINKDKIHVCKDCEFRYICTDCRAYIEDPKDLYSKPLKCGYNPYTGIWEEWSTNPLKQKAIKYYGMEALVKKDG